MNDRNEELPCPRCAAPLDASGNGRWCCRGCGGTLLGRDAVIALLDTAGATRPIGYATRPIGYRTSAHDDLALGVAPPPDEVRYLKCPFCEDQMHRTRFLAEDTAVADVCVLHALWFDVGEFERAVAGLGRSGPDCREALSPLLAAHFRGATPPESHDGAP